MSDSNSREGLLAEEDGEIYPLEQPSSVSAIDQEVYSGTSNENDLNHFADETYGTKIAEDGAKEDMFVDCPDEIENSESQQNSEEKEVLEKKDFSESDSGINVQHLMAEMELLRDTHEETVAENYRLARETEEDRSAYTREINHLYYRIKVVNEKEISPSENSGGLANPFKPEAAFSDDIALEPSASLQDMIDECSRFVSNTLEERAQSVAKNKELLSDLHMKNQEIDLLNAKVVELGKDPPVNEVVNRILSSLSITSHQEELLEGDLAEKLLNIETSVTLLVEKYNFFLSETYQLRACLTVVGSDPSMMDEIGTFVIAHNKIFELRRKEENLLQNISCLEEENRKLLEQLEKQKSIAGRASAEIQKLNAGLEQEKNRYSNTKEKLSIAVTKGKALVQQRDSLKLSLAERTSELEKCMIELQEKSNALEAAASLQECISEKDIVLQKCKEILAEGVTVEEPQLLDITEKLGRLVDENNSLKSLSLQYHRLTAALSVFTFPETVVSDELDARARWLVESLYMFKEEAMKSKNEIAEIKVAVNAMIDLLVTSLLAEMLEKSYLQFVLEDLTNDYEAQKKLQHDLAEAREASIIDINLLNASLSAESQEKNYFQTELENLRTEYEVLVQKEYHLSKEKDQMLSILMEASAYDSEKVVPTEQSGTTAMVNDCISKIKERVRQLELSDVCVEIFERFQSLLYVRDQEMRLYKFIVEEDTLDRLEINKLSNELLRMVQEFNALKNEKAIIQKGHDQLEEKCALLREKLSMAVKKGKGLFQERENLKGSLSEKNAEIDRLKSELQLNLSAYNECQDQIMKLSLVVNHSSKLETDLNETKKHADQLEQSLKESNSVLQRVTESIEDITAPADLVFDDPAEKVKWFVGYQKEHEITKIEVEQELRKVKDDASSLVNKLSEAQTLTETHENALLMAENNLSQLLDEKEELAVSKALLEEELQKKKEEASFHNSKFEEVSEGKRALEDALSLAENNVSRFMNDRDIAEENRTLTEVQLRKLKEEFSVHISKLADANKTIHDLEVALSEAQKNVLLLTEENCKVQIGVTGLDDEVKKFREQTHSQARELLDASTTIKSLEDALQLAENTIKDLVQEKKNAEQEILELNSKLKSCFEELSGLHGRRDNLSLELFGELRNLQLFLEDEALSTFLERCFGEKIESLKEMDFLLKDMNGIFQEINSDVLQNGLVVEGISFISPTVSCLDRALNGETPTDVVNSVGSESSIVSYIQNMIEKFHVKGKLLTEKLEIFSSCIDQSIAALYNGLHTTKDRTSSLAKYIKSLKKQLKEMETEKERQTDIIKSLENDMTIILSACTHVSEELELNTQKHISEMRSIQEFIKFDDRMSMGIGKAGDDASDGPASNHLKSAEMLALAARHNLNLSEHFLDTVNELIRLTKDMQIKLRETEMTCDEVSKERDLQRSKISKLETDLDLLQNSCHELKIKLDDYEEKEDDLRKREIELSTSLSKVQELENSPLSVFQIKSILHKMNDIEALETASELGDEESNDSAAIRKLFFVINSFNEFVQKVSALSSEKEVLQSTVEKRGLEIELLEKKIKDIIDDKKVNGDKMTDLLELDSGLWDIVQKLGGNDLLDSQKVAGAKWLLPLLDKLVMTSILESDRLKSENEELGAKLLETQRVVNDLSNKVKLLEDSNNARIPPIETELDGGTSVTSSSTQSEISEVQDMGALGKSNNIPLVPSAAHVRTLRKGSSDHLAISIGSESERLMNRESDVDKGHVFKSLNTSGLIPRQGRTTADRIDGIWVSGSQALMSRPRGRLGIIAYWLVLHIWLLGTIL